VNPDALQTDAFSGDVAQDDPNDPTMARYVQDFSVTSAAQVLELQLTGPGGSDLDLYLLYDANGDGTFDFDTEQVGASFTPTANEAIVLTGDDVAAGRYRAVVHGFDVPTAFAAFRLDVTQSVMLPDRIAADLPFALVDAVDSRALPQAVGGRVPPPVTGAAERAFPLPINPFGFVHPASQTRGQLRADLVIAHGAARMFFRYFSIVGDTIDARLLETLTSVDRYDGADRIAFWRTLRRFGEALHDGHSFAFSRTALYPTRLPVFLEHDDIRPIVRRSKVPGINAGDTIVALNGRAIEEVYAEELARTSAATVGYQLDIADRYIYAMNGPLTLDVEDVAGVRRTVVAQMQPLADYNDVVGRQATDRPSGPLTALGAPDLEYVNVNTFSASPSLVNAAIADASARGARGLILDVRGYPGNLDIYDVAARLIPTPFLSPMFITTTFDGPARSSAETDQIALAPVSSPPSYRGPIVLLSGPHAVSAAETFMQTFVGAHRVSAVVGRRSAGTNGDITELTLPGGFAFSFTGMEVRNPGGSRFHAIGIVPDVEVPVTARDLANGIDRDLLAAIALF
jgi:C-terminal processing protease CtpA/Prc